jgi:hypothetical protein
MVRKGVAVIAARNRLEKKEEHNEAQQAQKQNK